MTIRRIARRITTQTASRLRAVLVNVVARANRGKVTVAQYLEGLGADAELIRRYSGPLGKRVKAAYAELHGADPKRAGLAVVGHHLVRTYAYSTADLGILRAATAGYGRVAHLVNGGL